MKPATIREFTDAELQHLPTEQRDAITAHINQGLRYSDAAYQLGIPIGTVRSRIHRARAKVAAMRGIEAPPAPPAPPPLPSYEEALQDAAKARILFDASKGGNVRGITEDHRYQLAVVINAEAPAS